MGLRNVLKDSLGKYSSAGGLNTLHNFVSKRTMKKIFSLVIALGFAASSFAGVKKAPCCAVETGKTECSQVYAKLNLTPEQHSKLDAFQARCEKDGCKEESMKKFFKNAKS